MAEEAKNTLTLTGSLRPIQILFSGDDGDHFIDNGCRRDGTLYNLYQLRRRNIFGINPIAWGPNTIPAISQPKMEGIFILVISFPAIKAIKRTRIQRNKDSIMLFFSFRNSIEHATGQLGNYRFVYFYFFIPCHGLKSGLLKYPFTIVCIK